MRLPVVGVFEVNVFPDRVIRYHSSGEYIGKVLYWQGIWTHESTSERILAFLTQQAKVFLDVGAHTGLYTLLVKGINPEVLVYSFEPVPSVYQHLKLNIALNNFTETVTIEQAVVASSSAERVPFFVSPTQLATSSLKSEFTQDRHQAETIFVKSYGLDDYVKLNKIQKVDLIKIDVEGAEGEVLAGGQAVLRHHRPIILCEILPKNRQAFPKIEALLQTVQYEYALITPDGLITQKSLSAGPRLPLRSCIGFQGKYGLPALL